MNDWDRLHRQAQRYKEAYPPRTRIMLLSMGNDPNPVEGGTRGTVRAVDDETSLHISCKAIGEPNLIMFVAVFYERQDVSLQNEKASLFS